MLIAHASARLNSQVDTSSLGGNVPRHWTPIHSATVCAQTCWLAKALQSLSLSLSLCAQAPKSFHFLANDAAGTKLSGTCRLCLLCQQPHWRFLWPSTFSAQARPAPWIPMLLVCTPLCTTWLAGNVIRDVCNAFDENCLSISCSSVHSAFFLTSPIWVIQLSNRYYTTETKRASHKPLKSSCSSLNSQHGFTFRLLASKVSTVHVLCVSFVP